MLAALTSYTNTLYHQPIVGGKSIVACLPSYGNRLRGNCMSEQEKMPRYANKVKIRNYGRYTLKSDEITALYELSMSDIYRAICLAFDFGMAKGYRAAKREGTV